MKMTRILKKTNQRIQTDNNKMVAILRSNSNLMVIRNNHSISSITSQVKIISHSKAIITYKIRIN